ncbi:MAG: DNA replication/repair protein RecF [Coleofasciculaceae cyanobacterium SM2_1_6]|nr:DNA replication/repair protein RecF [Coleofasciculaceae cyanobacterium SM2_1_6]
MYLRTLHLQQFRNYQDQTVEFLAPKTILLGNNAQGKSNLLEAVELLATLKSHRAARDRELILEGAKASRITALLEREHSPLELVINFRLGSRRSMAINQQSMKRHLDFLGSLNAVQFSSLDLELVRGTPEKRRNWLDTILMQIEPVYSHVLHQYNQVLRQRNALLKTLQSHRFTKNNIPSSGESLGLLNSPDGANSDDFDNSHNLSNANNPNNLSNSPSNFREELALWDAQLATTGSRVTRRRARALERLAPLAQDWHTKISGRTETLTLNYLPNVTIPEDNPEKVQEAFLEKIQLRRIPEQQQGTSLVGSHRDDIEFLINQTPAKFYGSQGQQRTLVLALKLAELKLIEEVVGEAPLLLLDDVLAELDLHRQNQLLEAIQDRFQTLITTTHLGSFDTDWLRNSQILSVESGMVLDKF